MARLGLEEIESLETVLREELEENLLGILIRLNQLERLEEFFEMLGLSELMYCDPGYQSSGYGKILLVGQSKVKKEELEGIVKSLGLSKDRLEAHLDYEDGKSFDFSVAQYTDKYSVIMVGQMPHSGISKGDHSSVIEALKNEEGYPPVVSLGEGKLKISKTNFKNALADLIDRRIIRL